VPDPKWHCSDCFASELLCRFCMRQAHKNLPLHRIRRWTGTYFRPAALWEVGCHIIVPHMGKHCPHLMGLAKDIEKLEQDHDLGEETISKRCQTNSSIGTDQPEHEAETEGMASGHSSTNGRSFNHDDDLPNDLEEDGSYGTGDDDLWTVSSGTPRAPTMDAFKNPFVRVIHVNGVHEIPIVQCSCHGDHILQDLVFCGLVPTTFTKIHTVFTTQVLDHIRYSNLDMKSSYWQYTRLLRRLTQPRPAGGRSTLYRDIRFMSRMWRLLKKLKWAGYGHGSFMKENTSTTVNQHDNLERSNSQSVESLYVPPRNTVGSDSHIGTDEGAASLTCENTINLGNPLFPQPGQLAMFCPACPQIGLNVGPEWEKDPNQWVYTRFIVLDGNFKAGHVRQKENDDIWLLDGGGMFAKRTEFQNFYNAAHEKKAVRFHVPIVRND
jgi:hypothetical protein